MPFPGRNDPCPCGSGRKFKRCCGDHASDVTVGEITGDDRARAYDVLEPITKSPRFAEQYDAAVGMVTTGEDWTDLLGSKVLAGVLVDWLAFDVLLDRRERTAADYALADHAGELTPGARRFIDEMRRAPLRLVQVRTAFGAGGALLGDLLEPRTEYRVLEPTGLERHDVCPARLVERHGEPAFAQPPSVLALENRRRVIRALQRVRREALGTGATPALVRMIEGAFLVRLTAESEALLDGELETAAGDPIAPSLVQLRVIDDAALREALRHAPDFSIAETDTGLHVTWYDLAPNGTRRYALAHGERRRRRSTSRPCRRRAVRARDRLMALAGDSLACLAIGPLESSGGGDFRDEQGP